MYTTICNTAQIKYKSDCDGCQHTITTSPCTASVFTIDVPLQIMCSKSYAEVGEVFFYTFVFHNATPFTLTHLVCHDLLNPTLKYVENTLTYNTVLLGQMQFEGTIELPDLLPSRFGVLQFKVYATELPDPDVIINAYSITYDSITTSVSPVENKPELHATDVESYAVDTLYSGIVETYLGNCELHLEQTPDKKMLTKNSRVHMEGTVTNTGNTTLVDDYVSLEFPDGTSFVPNSLYVNGISVELTEENAFSVGTLHPNDLLSYCYELQVNEELPEGHLDAIAVAKGINSDIRSSHSTISSNEVVNHFIVDPHEPALEGVVLTLSASCCTVEWGDMFTYCLSINNYNEYSITALYLTDNLPEGVCYVPNSLMVNEINQQLSEFPSGLVLPDLEAKETHQITFRAMLCSLPETLQISNLFTLNYKYTTSECSDQSNTLVLSTSCHMLILRHTPDHVTLVSNDTICYTGTLSNLSSEDCLTTYISVCFPADACVVEDSVFVNGQPACFSAKGELYIDNLARGESVTYCYALILQDTLPDVLIDSAVAYGSSKDCCSTHPAVVSNTVVNKFCFSESTQYSESSSEESNKSSTPIEFINRPERTNSYGSFNEKCLMNEFIGGSYNANFPSSPTNTSDNYLQLLHLLIFLLYSV